MTVTSILTAPLRDEDLTLELASFRAHAVHEVPTYYFRMARCDSKEELGSIIFVRSQLLTSSSTPDTSATAFTPPVAAITMPCAPPAF
jgi:hypothetical protein